MNRKHLLLLALHCTISLSAFGFQKPEDMQRLGSEISELRKNIQVLKALTTQMEEMISKLGEVASRGRKGDYEEAFGWSFLILLLLIHQAKESVGQKLNSIKDSTTAIIGKIGAPFIEFFNPALNQTRTAELASSQNQIGISGTRLDVSTAYTDKVANFTDLTKNSMLSDPRNIPDGCKNNTKSVDAVGTCDHLGHQNKPDLP